MQPILVTGGAGHLGRLVTKHVRAASYSARGMCLWASPGANWLGAEE